QVLARLREQPETRARLAILGLEASPHLLVKARPGVYVAGSRAIRAGVLVRGSREPATRRACGADQLGGRREPVQSAPRYRSRWPRALGCHRAAGDAQQLVA